MTPPRLLDAVREVARICGDVASRHFRGMLRVERKPDGSEVTQADREAEFSARSWIEEHYPGDGIVGEELGAAVGSTHRRWFVDPIDGTRSFIRGVPLWGSLVAVEEGGTILAGAINCPATGDFVVAGRGEGCWHNDTRTAVSTTASISEAVILATDQRFPSRPERVARWTALADQVSITRSWGDCYGYVLVATGRADLMVDDRMSPWDVAALIPIIEEAGGVFTDWRGHGGIGTDAVASNGRLAGEFRRLLGVPERPADDARTAP